MKEPIKELQKELEKMFPGVMVTITNATQEPDISLLYARKALINGGDFPVVWLQREPFKKELRTLHKIGVDVHKLRWAIRTSKRLRENPHELNKFLNKTIWKTTK